MKTIKDYLLDLYLLLIFPIFDLSYKLFFSFYYLY